jgi:hypothetical protein
MMRQMNATTQSRMKKKTIVEESQDNWIEKNEVNETKTQPQEHP